MKTIIVAYDKHLGIGAKNDLLWMGDMPADLKHFRDTTAGATVIMGRNTYLSIGRPLPGRQNIVISRTGEPIDGVTVVDSLEKAYEISDREIYIIGGGQIYELAMPSADRIIATEVDGEFNADVFFPVIDLNVWKEVSREHHEKDESNKYNYDFVIYERA